MKVCVVCKTEIADRSTYIPTVKGPMHPSCWGHRSGSLNALIDQLERENARLREALRLADSAIQQCAATVASVRQEAEAVERAAALAICNQWATEGNQPIALLIAKDIREGTRK